MTEVRTRRRGRGRRPRSTAVRVVLSLGMVLGLSGTGTMALWSSSATASPGTITSAELDITVNGALAGAANRDGSRTELDWTMSHMLPGEQRAVTITVANPATGSIPVDVLLSAYATGALGPALRVTAYAGGTATNTGGSPTAPVASSYRTASCAGGTPTGTANASFGASAATANAVDSTAHRVGTGASFTYCLVVSVDPSAATRDNAAFRNAKATVSFVVGGTQAGAP